MGATPSPGPAACVAPFGACVAGGAAGGIITTWLWDIGAYLYTCYGYR
jgi:hypothetical protein